jgi:tetratricopeptide (TPR) repeat protein
MKVARMGLVLFSLASSFLAAQETQQQLALHQQRAQEFEVKQDFEGAIREYRVLLRSIPNNPELESNLGVAFYFHGDLGEAAEVLRRAVAHNSTLFAPHLFLGLVLAKQSRTDSAITELQKAEAISESDSLVHTWLGYEYSAQSHFEKASEQLRIAAQLKPDDQDVWFALGRCYLELGKAATEQLLREAPDGARTWQLAGEQYEAQGNDGKALQFYAAALQRRPDLSGLREKITALGRMAPDSSAPGLKASEFEDRMYQSVHEDESRATDAFEHISHLDPESYRAHQVMADSAAASDHFDDAIREYRIVLDKKSDLPEVHGDLCNALSRTARIEEAIRECDAELALSPYSAEAYTQAARVRLLAEQEAQAEPLLHKALALDHPPSAAYKLLGNIDLNRKRYPAAVQELNKFLASEPRDASAYFLLMRAYKGIGDTEKMNQAIAAYKHYSNLSKGNEDASKVLDKSSEQDLSLEQAKKKDSGQL